MRVAFYAPMKAPDHAIPSGDRAIARLFMAALTAGGHQAELICHFNSRDGTGNPERQARLRQLGRRLAARLATRLAHRPHQDRPRAWLTYHLYHKAPDWLGPTICRHLDIPYLVAEASLGAKQAGGLWDIGYQGAAQAIAQANRIFVINPKDAAGIAPAMTGDARLIPMAPFLDPAPYRAATASRAAHRRNLARQYGLPLADTWLLAVGMMRAGDKQQSYRLLGQALTDLAPGGWQLLIVGDGPLRAQIAAAMPAAIQNRLHWLGAQPPADLPAIYAACDIMVWPAVREAIGMALLEAQAAGLPVVAGDEGAVATIVEHAVTGLLTPPGDPGQFAGAVTQLLTQTPLRARFAQAAVAKVARQHDIAAAAGLLDRTLAALVPGS
ncbi:MAG: glycosyltransferase family 4 protein [Alphaproteobacteria bacterium]